ncbi:energy-coupling factor transport system substrate-specific component [Streptomyces sp. Amel2xB2]|uniref:ECF transporter S component n=1 Tax=Streptomyces sp. Amel2xB2 TaxID=1305829 RepID=UPI000DB9F642|nr:ECF transporter S component [Streptomyces sp. Amel2xB2]RAJ71264.1 energy-coupling factor transport system substrate-specific component [Streptomyces sp. Amel2xB2]
MSTDANATTDAARATAATTAGERNGRRGRRPYAPPGHRASAIRISGRTALVLTLASLAGLTMFFWPLFAPPQPDANAHSTDAPLLFVLAMPVVLAVVLAELSSGGIDTKALAMLGVLSAVNAGLRPLGAGTAGIETVFFLLILAGRVFGPGFGFALGATSLFASALLTAGVGPWLPFQMACSAWIGLGAGLLPRRVTGRWEIAMLAAYGVVAAYAFGFIMNMWFWPFTAGADTQLSFDPDASVPENLHTFFVFTLATSTFGWDTGRAVTNLVAVLLTGRAVLATLRRANRRAAFEAPVTFSRSASRSSSPSSPGRVPAATKAARTRSSSVSVKEFTP